MTERERKALLAAQSALNNPINMELRDRAFRAINLALHAQPASPLRGRVPADDDWKRAVECAFLCLHNVSITRAELDNAMQHAFGILALASPQEQPATLRGRNELIEQCAKVAEAQAQEFLSPKYAVNQPFSTICERFACEEVAKAIRALSASPPEQPALRGRSELADKLLDRWDANENESNPLSNGKCIRLWIAELDAIHAALSAPEQPAATLVGMIAAIYGELDAEDCNMIDRAWIKWRGQGTIAYALSTIMPKETETP